MSQLSAAAFALFLMERAAKKDGYIMGARGENPRKWAVNRWPYTQYSGAQLRQAKKWREKCERVWDCQGMVEGYINEMTGSKIDVRARNNYASWCDPKGKGTIPAQYRVPGAAVFKANSSGTIHHVGYLVTPVNADKPDGDWYVIEAKGVMYGVVRTKLSDGGWNLWGLMTKYFEYYSDFTVPEFGDRELKRGDVGDDVRELQGMLIDLGFDCGKWGTDGDFGADTEAAVKAFQTTYRLPITGAVGEDDFEALRDAFLPDDADEGIIEPIPIEQEPSEEPEPLPPLLFPVDCLDLSSHNSAKEPKIDWDKIKKQVGFLILRCGCTRVKTKPLGIGADAYFEKWAQKCNEYGIPFWAYYYSNAADGAQARQEASYAYAIAEKYNPVGYCMDCEEAGLNRKKILAWFERIEEITDRPTMIYVAHHRYTQYKLNVIEDDDGYCEIADAIWIPRYGDNNGRARDKYRPRFKCDMWQYTSVFALDGIPDKTLDANKIIGRRSMAWFRGEK